MVTRRRPPGRLLLWSAVVLVVAVLVTAMLRDEPGRVGDPTVGDVVRIGVVEGESIPDYLRSSGEELAQLLATPTEQVEVYALVVFATYLNPDQLTPVLAGAAPAEVITRVPLPGTQTEIVRIPVGRLPDDVRAGMVQVAKRKEREARDYRDRSGEMTSDDDVRQVYESNAWVADQEAAAYRSSCACVYAAVVRAAPAVLDEIARRPGVRTVDPAPEVVRLDRAVFLPPLPEQEDVVRPPADDHLPGLDRTTDGGSGGMVWPK
jgi:hypothetical protein